MILARLAATAFVLAAVWFVLRPRPSPSQTQLDGYSANGFDLQKPHLAEFRLHVKDDATRLATLKRAQEQRIQVECKPGAEHCVRTVVLTPTAAAVDELRVTMENLGKPVGATFADWRLVRPVTPAQKD